VSTATAELSNTQGEPLRAGLVLDGKYRVDYLVGQGGMAAVWAGTNERTGKRVALKVLLPSLGATVGVDALFQREALAASRINHPNVVTVFDVVTHEETACIVMELLDGHPLDVHLARAGKLGPVEACGLLLPAMRGVSAAHGQGVIHRDLKPQNIFICVGPDGRVVTTKVLDFGISLIRTVDSPFAGAPLPMGTPAYMAPEQIAGEPIDERADVYGFGVLFFEALTGDVPFPGRPGAELYQRVLYERPPRLSELRPDVPAAIAAAVDAALAKDRADRHANLDVMIAAIEDEVAAATPLPGDRLLLESGPTPQAMIRAERSEPHQATQFMVNFPLAVGGGGGTAATDLVLAHRVATGVRRLVALRAWQGLAGLAFAALAAGGGYLLWSAGAGRSTAQARLPSLVVQPSLLLASPAPAPVIEPLGPAVFPAASLPAVPSLAVPAPPVTAVVVPASPRPATVSPQGRHKPSPSPSSKLASPSSVPSPAARAETARIAPSRLVPSPVKAAVKPRAGRLRAADF
jgi:hypothetical protein